MQQWYWSYACQLHNVCMYVTEVVPAGVVGKKYSIDCYALKCTKINTSYLQGLVCVSACFYNTSWPSFCLSFITTSPCQSQYITQQKITSKTFQYIRSSRKTLILYLIYKLKFLYLLGAQPPCFRDPLLCLAPSENHKSATELHVFLHA